MNSPEARLAERAIQLPPVPTPLGAYVPAVRSGDLLFLSGMLPIVGREPKYRGHIGKELSAEEGGRAAYAAALNALAVMRQHLGSLDRVSRVVRLGVHLAVFGETVDLPKIADSASDLFRDVFGEEKMSSRFLVGVERLALDVPVALEVILEVESEP